MKKHRHRRPKTFEYDVCLSFAGEDREYVKRVAESLQSRGVRLFYDEYEKVRLWGKDNYAQLDHIYRFAARYCVLFISKHYAKKLWPNHERQSAQARAFTENDEYLLPVRFDDTEIPGIRPTTGYIDSRATQPEELAAIIIAKLGDRSESIVASLNELIPQKAVPILIDMLNTSDTHTRCKAAEMLADIGSPAVAAVNDLTKTLGDASPRVRGLAARALAQIGKQASSSLPKLVKLLTDPDLIVREQTVAALDAIDPSKEARIPLLIESLADSNEATVEVVASELG
jgi:hypothetical protein